MVRAWYMDDSEEDQRLPHMTDPPQFVSLEDLVKLTGVTYWKINADDYENDDQLTEIRKSHGYSYSDEVNITKEWPQYAEKIKAFYEEHLHTDEEIRLILDGSGYFDTRTKEDRWVRIEMSKGDMIVLPAGIYHRFTLDTKDFVLAKRYFVGEPVWTPHNRPADDLECRKQYVKVMEA